jgi:hypothetical protein
MRLLPRVAKHYLFLIAALVWTFAGVMLLFRGFTFKVGTPENWSLKLIISILSGLLFYQLLFTRITKKHVARIQDMEVQKPVIFSFFNFRSYLMMFSMITLGVSLRLSGLVLPEYLSLMYITMGIPLLLSSYRFYSSFFFSKNAGESL